MTKQEFYDFLDEYHSIFLLLFVCILIITGVLFTMVALNLTPVAPAFPMSRPKVEDKEDLERIIAETSYQTGAELKPLPNDQSQVINDIARLRLRGLIITSEFNLKYNLDQNLFEVTLAEGASNQDVFNWLRNEGYPNIPPEKFVF